MGVINSKIKRDTPRSLRTINISSFNVTIYGGGLQIEHGPIGPLCATIFDGRLCIIFELLYQKIHTNSKPVVHYLFLYGNQ